MLDSLIDQAKAAREDIRAIVVYGEASSPSVGELGVLARQVVGTDTVKIVTDLAPTDVVPHGAAIWARIVGSALAPEPEQVEVQPRQIPMYNKLLEAPKEPL